MVALESLKSNGGDTGKLGDKNDMNPPNKIRRTFQKLVVDVYVNINLVPLEPVSDLTH